jgi:hypothetical protein
VKLHRDTYSVLFAMILLTALIAIFLAVVNPIH